MEAKTSEPAVAPGRSNRTRLAVVAVSVLAILAALAAAAYFSLERPAGLTGELMEQGVFISAEGAYVYKDGDFVPLSTEGGIQVLEAKQSNGHTAFIGRGAGGEYSVRWDGEVIAKSEYPMRDLALSPEGTKVAYAEQVSGETDSSAISDWTVTVRDLAENGETRTYPGSFSPYFLGDAHMLRLTAGGILYVDLVNASEFVFATGSFDDAHALSLQSPSRRVIAWETPMDGYSEEPILLLTNVTQVSPLESEFLGINQIYPDVAFALGVEGLYELRQNASGSELWIRTVEQPMAKKLYAFPAELGITKVMFQ